jgi:predicted NUDIX family phosphoesterase
MEFVYVVKRYDLFDLEFPHGFRTAEEAGLPELLERARAKGFFVERRYTETDSSFKQIIPYGLVTCGDSVFLLRRTSNGGEARLHGRLSVGVGGHINPVDEEVGDVVEAGAERELEEEIVIDAPFTREPVGIINDDASPVGSVHFGIVFRIEVERPEVRVRETDQLEGEFVSRAVLKEMLATERNRFETWSSLILDRLDDALPVGC